MSRPPDYMYRVSEALAEVMDDIGVNERLVRKYRRRILLQETFFNIPIKTSRLARIRLYIFGSQSEGSTTLQLGSDIDMVIVGNEENVIQNVSEWKLGFHNLMILQNELVSPGYCHLQLIRRDRPLPAKVNDVNRNPSLAFYVTDRDGKVLWKNSHTYFHSHLYHVPGHQAHVQGPALMEPGSPGCPPSDTVFGHYCESSPHQVTSWLRKQRKRKWPTKHVLKDCRNAGCFVVPVGSKVNSPDTLESELEWRISTSLQERYLMFSLNIPQLMCYILMKMILKTHIHPYVPDVLTSFMCKNVLLYCISNSSHDWHTGNLLANLRNCLSMLKECVRQRNCPHLIISENNLLAGRMTDTQRGKLLSIIDNLMEDDALLLLQIQIEDLDRRLMMKLYMIPYAEDINWLMNSYMSAIVTINSPNAYLIQVLNQIKSESLEIAFSFLSVIYSYINHCGQIRKDKLFPHADVDLLQTARELLRPLLSSALGSLLATKDVVTHIAVSDQANTHLEAGKESDAMSGRLKLISVLYCTGDMEKAECELTIIQTQCDIAEVVTMCTCTSKELTIPKLRGIIKLEHCCETEIRSHVALCTRFLQCELNCVPHELRYEVLRSFNEKDNKLRVQLDILWMDFIVVDSIPFYYFMQYKVLGYLQSRREQRKALYNFAQSIELEIYLGHKETALNLLGQCLEQENRKTEALQCYILSVKHRKRNNAARFLLCIQLYKLCQQDNSQ